ncbi:hypothetical protein [Leucobacter triazinivorans]|nr:hypothetical protein [Leucobacter triazinivorans]
MGSLIAVLVLPTTGGSTRFTTVLPALLATDSIRVVEAVSSQE